MNIRTHHLILFAVGASALLGLSLLVDSPAETVASRPAERVSTAPEATLEERASEGDPSQPARPQVPGALPEPGLPSKRVAPMASAAATAHRPVEIQRAAPLEVLPPFPADTPIAETSEPQEVEHLSLTGHPARDNAKKPHYFIARPLKNLTERVEASVQEPAAVEAAAEAGPAMAKATPSDPAEGRVDQPAPQPEIDVAVRPTEADPSAGDSPLPEAVPLAEDEPGVAPEPSEAHSPDAEVPVGDPERQNPLVSVFLLGGSSTHEEQRRVGWGIPQRGWGVFVDRYVEPQLAEGVTRFILLNPFGTLPKQDMQFDQYIEAQTNRYGLLTKDFVESWQPITATGIEVIGYIGTPWLDKTSQAFEEAEDWEGFLKHARACIQPFRDAGMNIGYDAAVSQDPDSYTYRFAEWMRNQGIRVYVESRPKVSRMHWTPYPAVVVDWVWNRFEPEGRKDADPFVTQAQMQDEVLLLLIDRPDDMSVVEWVEDRYSRYTAAGYSVGAPLFPYMRDGGLVKDRLIQGAESTSFD